MTADAVGGVWTYALGLTEGLSRAGVGVTLVVLGPSPSADQRRAAQAIAGVRLRTLEGPLDWVAQTEAELRPAAAGLARLADVAGVDVVHLNSPALASLAAFNRPVLTTCHSCVASWWRALGRGALPPDLEWRRDLLARGYAASDRCVAPTRSFAGITETLYGGSVQVVLNGVAPADLAPKTERFALTAGRMWDEAKDIATLDQAAGLISAPLVALGSFEGPDGVRANVRRAKAVDWAPRALVAAWMRRAPVFVSAARYEPFGLAVLEAASAGCALVLSDISSFRELWDGAAAFVRPGDSAGFARAIEGLLSDPAAADAAGAEARKRAQTYTLTKATAGTLAHYRDLSPAAFAGLPVMEVAA